MSRDFQSIAGLFARNLQRAKLSVSLVVMLSSFATASAAHAQSAHRSSVRRDAEAVAIVQKALKAIGGESAWEQAQDATFAGTWEMPNPEGGKPLARAEFLWITKGKEFRYQIGSGSGQVVYLSGHGRPSMRSPEISSALTPEYQQRKLPFHLPGFQLLTMLNETSRLLIFEGDEEMGATRALHVKTQSFLGPAMLTGTQQDWWFDPVTGLPLKVSYLLPGEDGKQQLQMERTYAGWTAMHKLLLPTEMTDVLEGQVVIAADAVKSVAINTNPAEKLFDVR